MNNQQKQFVVRLNCTELNSLQNFSVINPQIIVYQQTGNQWNEKGKTEIQFNQRNPKFSTAIPLNYEFEQQFNVKFEIYNCDQNKKHPIGNTIVNITSLLTAKDQIYYTDILSHTKFVGKIVILGEYQRYKCDLVELQITARNLKLKKWCTCQIPPNRPFIKISRQLQDTQKIVEVFTSESIKYPQSQSWPTIKLLARDLCNNDNDNPLTIELNEQINKSNQAFIGQLSVSVNQMMEHSGQPRFLKDQNQQIKGELQFCCKLKEQPIFEEYIQGGLQLNLVISVDFTDSNLEPMNPSSLHYFDQNAKKMSQYETALRTASEILIQYDHDKKVPIFGFGFVLPGSDKTEHCYPLNGNIEDPEVSELFGIFSTYRHFVRQVKFSGPTLFRPTLQEAMKLARGFKQNGSKKYVVLAILTDGQIGDFDGTFENIVDCCDLPISIIIIGIGNEDFTNMERLNNNDLKEFDQQGRQATRDLVKFVEFKKFQNDSKILAKEVLSELPDQVVSYMVSQGIMPNSMQRSLNQNGQNGQDYKQYYQNQKVQRQSTLKRFLNEDDDIREKDEGTIVTKNFLKPQQLSIDEIQIMQNNQNSVQFQQQLQQLDQIQQQNFVIEQPKIQFQGSLSNVLNPLNYAHVGNPMISGINSEFNQKSNQNKQEPQQNNLFQQQFQNNQYQLLQNQNPNQVFSDIREEQDDNHDHHSGAIRMISLSEEHQSLNQNNNLSDAQFQQNQARLSQIQNQQKIQ